MDDMKLSKYMEVKGLSDAQFAALGPFPIRTVEKWRRDERYPRRRHLQRIAEATNGDVMPNDFAGIPGIEKSAAE
jgi:transcriptional regulator with XRE-family HTH domain